MVFKIFVVIALIASVVHAAAYFNNLDVFKCLIGHQSNYPMKFNKLFAMHQIRLPTPPVPSTPPLMLNFYHHPVPFVPFKSFQPSVIHVPSPQEIAVIKPGPNQNLNAMSVQSNSYYEKDEQGKLVKKGGTTIVINDNGDERKIEVGNSPPKVTDKIIAPVPVLVPIIEEVPIEVPEIFFPEIQFPEFVVPLPEIPYIIEPQFPQHLMQPFLQPKFTFEPFVPIIMKSIQPIVHLDIDTVESMKPDEKSNSQSFSTSSHSESSNINRVQASGGKFRGEEKEYVAGDQNKSQNTTKDVTDVKNDQSSTDILNSFIHWLLPSKNQTNVTLSLKDVKKLIAENQPSETQKSNNDQKLSKNDQKLSENDQKSSKNDQRSSKNDQISSKNDQISSKNDQNSSKNDQNSSKNDQKSSKDDKKPNDNSKPKNPSPAPVKEENVM